MATQRTKWLRVLKPISPRANLIIGCLSFVVPILIWSLVSYVHWIWHPQIFITNPGSVDYLQAGMRMDKEAFANEVVQAKEEKRDPPQGVPANLSICQPRMRWRLRSTPPSPRRLPPKTAIGSTRVFGTAFKSSFGAS
jgi:hypothetical protein